MLENFIGYAQIEQQLAHQTKTWMEARTMLDDAENTGIIPDESRFTRLTSEMPIIEATAQSDSIPGMSEATGEAPSVTNTIVETRQARFAESTDIARMRAMNRIPAMESQNPVPQTRIVPF